LVSTSPTSWRVTFTLPALDCPALRCANSYEFSPDLEVFSVTPEDAENPLYVDIETSEQIDSQEYELTIHLIEAAQ